MYGIWFAVGLIIIIIIIIIIAIARCESTADVPLPQVAFVDVHVDSCTRNRSSSIPISPVPHQTSPCPSVFQVTSPAAVFPADNSLRLVRRRFMATNEPPRMEAQWQIQDFAKNAVCLGGTWR